jgi:glycosyltransferase involved in cell wall biosynthesis
MLPPRAEPRQAVGPSPSSTSTPPLVSVVMTTYGDEPDRLRRAIDSILAQTLIDLECIVVFEPNDDNYTVLARTVTDPRVVLVQGAQGRGKPACFNAGLEVARGRYIARMDSDDFAYSERLARQVAFLETNPDISIVGSAGRLLDERDRVVGVRQFPSSHEGILRSMIVTNPIFHPSVVWDRDRVGRDLRYDARVRVEDLELWMRLIRGGHRFANLPEVLIDYRQPPKYSRPRGNWRGVLFVRLRHWRIGFKYPPILAGIPVFCGLSVMPQAIIDRIVGRNRISDRLRWIRKA